MQTNYGTKHLHLILLSQDINRQLAKIAWNDYQYWLIQMITYYRSKNFHRYKSFTIYTVQSGIGWHRTVSDRCLIRVDQKVRHTIAYRFDFNTLPIAQYKLLTHPINPIAEAGNQCSVPTELQKQKQNLLLIK